MSVPTVEQLKARSKHLSKLLQEKYKVKVSHGQCLDIVAQLFGHKDWNTACAVSPHDSAEVSLNGRYKLAEALTEGFHFSVQQPYKIEKYHAGGGVSASRSTVKSVRTFDQFEVLIDPLNRKAKLVLPLSTSETTSDAVFEMNKQKYLNSEEYFAEQLGGKAEDLANPNTKP